MLFAPQSNMKETGSFFYSFAHRVTKRNEKFNQLLGATEATWSFFMTFLIQLNIWISTKYSDLGVELSVSLQLSHKSGMQLLHGIGEALQKENELMEWLDF